MSDKSTEEALRLEFLIKVRDDPVLFARSFIPDPIKPGQMFNPFPYQEEWLRSTNKRLIAVCVPPWTKVLAKEGEREINDLKPGDFIITHKGREKRVIAVLSRPYRGWLYVVADGKKRLYITPEHPLLTKVNGKVGWNEGRVLFERLTEGSKIEICQINANSKGLHRGAFGWRRLSLPECGLEEKENFVQSDLAGYPVCAPSLNQPEIPQRQDIILASKDIGRICHQTEQTYPFGGLLGSIGEDNIIRTPITTFAISSYQKRSCSPSFEGMQYNSQANGGAWPSDFDESVEESLRFERSDHRNQLGRSARQMSGRQTKQQAPFINVTNYDGKVFNLIVEDDESYIAESFVTHNCGRQVGKSTIAAIALIHFAMCNPKTTSIIVSSSLRQSMETFDKVVMFLYGSVLESSVASHTRTRIMFKNGARIICLPCGRYGFSLRGLTVHFAVLDEAAFMPEEVISNVVFPMLATTNGILWMLTTPWSYVGSPPKVDAEWKEGGK